MNTTFRTEISKKIHFGTKSWYYHKFLFAFSMNQFYNYTNGIANHCHIIFILEKTGLQAIGYHENDAKTSWYWIGTKKSLNDMEWLRKLKYTIQIYIEINEIYEKVQRTLRV